MPVSRTCMIPALALSLAALSAPAAAQASKRDNVIENTVALQVAQNKCGVSVNYEMLSMALSSVGVQPDDLVRGGKHYGAVERHQARVRNLTATESGRASFCGSVRRDLSAMLD